ncbi:MAG: hypothetical protein KKF54_09080 [Candidatus Omnitrophica bacterium]|nr:hypothetical protein [Candidatus Omnitrophota bacterium]
MKIFVRTGDRRGAILMMVLIVILTISLLGASLTLFFFDVFISIRTELDRARALYLAEAGISMAVNKFKNQARTEGVSAVSVKSTGDLQQIVARTQLDEGFFTVYHDFSQSAVVSVGESNGVKRAIQLKFKTF